MSIDRLQEKIRKLKNPSIIDMSLSQEQIPPYILQEEGGFEKAYLRCCYELLEGLRGIVPAVRFNFGRFALLGTEGLVTLTRVTDYARKLGFYILLEIPDASSYQTAVFNAGALLSESCNWTFDGLIVSAYIGSDGIKPYAVKLEDSEKSLFVAVRTGNRSATEIQDLLTGGRHVFEAKTDVVNRFKNTVASKCGYDRVAIVGPASSASILKKLRGKYKNLFILVDDYDSPSANAKNCAEAADQYGHGTVVCAGTSVTAAWIEADNAGLDYVDDAIEAAERMKKNLTRYFAVL